MRAPYAYTAHTYALGFTRPNGTTGGWGFISREHAADKLVMLRGLLAEGIITAIRIDHLATRVEPMYVAMCEGCQDRPSLRDWDCDGAYNTYACGVCDWDACFDRRHPQ